MHTTSVHNWPGRRRRASPAAPCVFTSASRLARPYAPDIRRARRSRRHAMHYPVWAHAQHHHRASRPACLCQCAFFATGYSHGRAMLLSASRPARAGACSLTAACIARGRATRPPHRARRARARRL